MNANKQSTPTLSIYGDAYQTFKAVLKPSLQLASLAIFAPQLIVMLFLAYISQPVVASIKELASAMLVAKENLSYIALLEKSAEFFTTYLLVMIVLLVVFFAAYLGLVKLAISAKQGKKIPSAAKVFVWALRKMLPGGLLMFAAILFISLERFLWGPFRIFSMLALMAPVIFIVEKRGVGVSLWRSLFLKYTHPATTSAFSTAVTLIVFGAFLFLGELAISWLGNALLTADEWLMLPRDLWNQAVPEFPFSTVYLLQRIMMAAGYSLLLLMPPFFTVSLYFFVIPRLSQRI
ncbi:MAG: hypothetical protein HYW48_12215 [Deltaproteobacteria bacterium]|nr:hypothetical protein [Deltaproteobacteria bacterium]